MSNLNTASVLDSVLATLVGSYSVSETPVVMTRKASKPRADRSVRVVKASNSAVTVKKSAPIAVPAVGTLNAAGFILALRDAGKVSKANENGVMITLTDSNKERVDQVQAIAAYVGYNFAGAHGMQLDSARQKASYELRPVKADSKVTVTVKGFVAGMPNGTAKKVSDLQGRIRFSTDLMLDEEKKAESFSKDSAEYVTHMALAGVERERIAHMNKDLSNILG
jgi:hypothetical protein